MTDLSDLSCPSSTTLTLKVWLWEFVMPSIPTFLLDYFFPAFQKAMHTRATGIPAAQGQDRHMEPASH